MRNKLGQFIKGHPLINGGSKGKHWKISEEDRKKNSESHKGINTWMKGRKLPEETRKKISYSLMGITRSKETRKKMSEFQKGKKLSNEHKRKISNCLLGKTGKDARNWQGGKSFEPYSVDWSETLRRSIRERDNYVCDLCHQYGKDVHHIDYDKKNCNPNNLITLCKKCNTRVNRNRDYWTNYFSNKLCKDGN